MKGSGSAWVSSLRKNMIDLGFTPCRANGDVWIRLYVNTLEYGSISDDGLFAGERYYK